MDPLRRFSACISSPPREYWKKNMKNRNILPKTGALLLAFFCTGQAFAQQVDIKSTTSTRQVYQVTGQLEGRGVVIPENEKALRLKVDASFEYEERVIARASQLKSIRNYQDAHAKISVDNKPMINQLSRDNHIIITQTKAADQPIKLASLGGPITQNEFELIDTPANTLILSEVFARNSVKKGDKWKADSEVLAQFLNIDSVDESDVQIELAKQQGDQLVLVIGGDVTGTIDGAGTELSINGSVRFDNAEGIVSESRLTISQQRDVGLMAPGLDATFKLATKIKPISTSQHLTDQGLDALRKSAKRITDNLVLSPNACPVSMLHPHEWKVIADHSGRTILRYNDRGRMIGQCDIIPLPKRLTNQEQTLDQFKAVVKDKLSTSSGEIIAANQARTETGLEWMRVDAKGATQGVNLQWTYYTITSPDGRRVQMVFTTEPSNARAFAGVDRYLIDSVRFAPLANNKTGGQNAGFRQPASKKN